MGWSRRAPRGLLVPALLLAGCGGQEGPRWIPLAGLPAGAVVRERAAAEDRPLVSEDGRAFRLTRDAAGTWIETTLRRADWAFKPGIGLWGADLAIRGVGVPEDGSPPQRLAGGGRAFDWFPMSDFRRDEELAPGSFLARKGRILLALEEGGEPAEELSLALFVARERVEDGRHRVVGRRFSGDGFSVWSGERVTLRASVPRGSLLRLATCVEPAPSTAASGRPVVFRVRVDGAVLLEHAVEELSGPRSTWHALELEAGRREVTLEVDGPFAYASFLAPTLAPAHAPDGGASRPDLVVLLADTFRADNLAAWGGTPGLAPNLDRLAERGLRFPRAWSVGTHTLPAHASLFGGVFPRQAGAVGTARALPAGLVTVAERLRDAGYRTGAVTDSVIVSQKFAMDQGFEWFDEELADLDSTLARVRSFLDAGDGRPTFLFVQSYRAHTPYRVSPETRAELGARLGIEGEFEEWNTRLRELLRTPEDGGLEGDLGREVVAGLERLYRGGVRDLDRGFARLLAELEGRGVPDPGFLVFTSDHGEAFREHDALFHGGRVWEELIRVPLVLLGPGIEPGVSARTASLVDLAPTLADLAGIGPHPGWVGRPLLVQADDRPAFAFQCWRDPERSTLAVIQGDHKVFATEDPEALRAGDVLFAFDLGRDPGESADVAPSDEEWPARLLERTRGALEAALLPLHGERAAELDADKLSELRAMGYGGS